MRQPQRTLQRFPRPSGSVYTFVFAASTIAIAVGYARMVIESFGKTTMDDAYMFARYAEHALDGLGFAWNPDGVQTYGSTSLLFQVLVIALRAAMPSVSSSVLLNSASALPGLLSLLVMSAIAVRFTSFGPKGSPYLAWTTTLGTLLLTSSHFRFHATTGMDTMLSFLCNTLLILATLQFSRKALPLPFLVLGAYLSYATRPDNLIYAVLFPPLGILLLVPRRRRKDAILFLLGIGGLIALDAIVKVAVFGDPLPLPFYAKRSGYQDGYLGIDGWSSMEYLLAFMATALPFLGLIVLGLDRHTVPLGIVFLGPLALTVAFYFSVVQIMGWEARYYFPSLPFIIVCSLLVLDRQFGGNTPRMELAEVTLVRVIAFGLLAALTTSPVLRDSLSTYYRTHFVPEPTVYSSAVEYDTPAPGPLPRLGWGTSIAALAEVAASLPAGTQFALSEHGYIGARAPQVYILDPLGLHDPYFAHHGFSAQEFFRRQPDLIWLPHPDYSRIVSEILDAPEFRESYDYYPGAFDYGLAIYRDSPYYDSICDAISHAWRENYGNAEMPAYLARASRQPILLPGSHSAMPTQDAKLESGK